MRGDRSSLVTEPIISIGDLNQRIEFMSQVRGYGVNQSEIDYQTLGAAWAAVRALKVAFQGDTPVSEEATHLFVTRQRRDIDDGKVKFIGWRGDLYRVIGVQSIGRNHEYWKFVTAKETDVD